jgi:hypothetical protein
MATNGRRISPDIMEDLELQNGSSSSQPPLNVATANTIHVKVENDKNELPVEIIIAGDTSSLITEDENRVSKTYGAIGGESAPASASAASIKKTWKISSLPPKGGSHDHSEKARTFSFPGVSDDESFDPTKRGNHRLKKERTVSFSGVPVDDDDEEVASSAPTGDSPSRGWSKIKGFVKRGSFLLTIPQTDNKNEGLKPSKRIRRHDSLAKQHMEEIRAGIEFSTFHCILAIILYLGISVGCYKLVLQPEWSVTDCCYFAVTTFTTVGFGYVRST